MVAGDDERKEDERLLARAEETLTEIKVTTGLSEPHAAGLGSLRIRLKGDPGGNLDDLMAAAGDLEGPRLTTSSTRRRETSLVPRRPVVEGREAQTLPRRSARVAAIVRRRCT